MNLEQIAEMAGVSRATVSRVINNYPHVRDDVRQRVLAVIEREGFQPNAAARMLVKQRTEVLGVIAPEGLGSIFTNPFYPILFEGISAAIIQTDYAMSLWAGVTPEETERTYRRILGYKMMDGALIVSSIDGDSLPRRLLERKMPFVLIGRSELPDVCTVDVDNVVAARTATEHLVRLGRRRIAHISGDLKVISARERAHGYRLALEASRLPYDPALLVEGGFSEDDGYLAARRLEGLGVDAVFAANDTVATGAMHAFLERGLAIPQDVAIIGFDDLPSSSQTMPTLSTIRQPIRELGIVAVRTLIDLIAGNVTSAHRVVLPTELIIRDSCGTLR
ncbi:MAG TPA: LacI family DNA-binding transcriptional regulator [Aggregatilineales bacterium]|nr:LacI family DNA-binding transcriptional regulator [Aggregatilineales bacterium]